MKTRVLITTVVSFLLLVAVIAAGLNAVFTITLVHAEFSVTSAEGQAEAEELKEKLDKYVGSSTTFLKLDEVWKETEAYPCLKVEKLEKKFPSTLEVKITERNEVFALEKENGYAILGEEGYYLYDRGTLSNRSGGENILLQNIACEGKPGEVVTGELFDEILAVYTVFSGALFEVRANIVSITYVGGEVFSSFMIQMREGIRIEILEPTVLTAEKAAAALHDETYGYLARADEERVSGLITVVASGENVLVNYDFSRN